MRTVIFVFAFLIIALILLGQAALLCLSPGKRFQTPEAAVDAYWQAQNQGNAMAMAICWDGVFMANLPSVAKQMMPSPIKTQGVEIFQKTALADTLVHLKYWVKLSGGRKFKTGDLLIYDPYLGWRIFWPCSEPPDPKIFQ